MDWNNIEKRLAEFDKARRPEKIELNNCNGCKSENEKEKNDTLPK